MKEEDKVLKALKNLRESWNKRAKEGDYTAKIRVQEYDIMIKKRNEEQTLLK